MINITINIKSILKDEYLDYVNNYISVDVFAEHRGLTKDQALALIGLGKECHEHDLEKCRD